jgi:uncharacterized membrane protein
MYVLIYGSREIHKERLAIKYVSGFSYRDGLNTGLGSICLWGVPTKLISLSIYKIKLYPLDL